MTIESLETVVLTCIFVVPGFLIDGIVNSFSPQGKRKDSVYFLYCLLYSAIHCAIFSWVYICIWKNNIANLSVFFLLMCVTALIGAVILGILIGLLKSKKWICKILNKFGCNVSSSIPTAWDYFFHKQEPSYLIVILNSGEKIFAYYGSKSYSSSDFDNRDLYLEKIYDFTEKDGWVEKERNTGIYINLCQIKTIEFLGGERNEN